MSIDFSLNGSRLEAGLTAGQLGSFTDYARFGMGAYVMYDGFHLDFIKDERKMREIFDKCFI